ncbi:neurotrophin-3 [Protopterus annectens]|uniref:neurotrophin-3 n=1 Tax=Protopterus annectens TaxID=7888 RepID=UPI001CFB11BA|nr:neurotrophin-3 [Protopterus annectens]
MHNTYITILQVNKGMTTFLCMMFLSYLCSTQTAHLNKQTVEEDSMNALIIKLIQADLLKTKITNHESEIQEKQQDIQQSTELADASDSVDDTSDFQPISSIDTDVIRQQKRYHSPRVLLSENPPVRPPPLYLIDDYVGSSVTANRTSRMKRQAEHRSHRGEYSVCDSESLWVTDKSSAVDIQGQQVTVLGEVKSGNSPIKQYFYETRCKAARPYKNGCRGIDDKHWNSQCKTSQTYVRALTSENNVRVGWRWIRIDTACVCALSRKTGRM